MTTYGIHCQINLIVGHYLNNEHDNGVFLAGSFWNDNKIEYNLVEQILAFRILCEIIISPRNRV